MPTQINPLSSSFRIEQERIAQQLREQLPSLRNNSFGTRFGQTNSFVTDPTATEEPKIKKEKKMKQPDGKKLTFGIEIECQIPSVTRSQNGNERAMRETDIIRPEFSSNWNYSHDGSIRQIAGFNTAEIKSGILAYPSNLPDVGNFVAHLQSKGVQTDDSCGGHVHIGMQEFFADMTIDKKFAVVGRIIENMTRIENAIFFYSGGKARSTGQYAKSIIDNAKRSPFSLFNDRYNALNVSSLINKGTVEFRIFVGTISPEVWKANIKIATGIVMESIKGRLLPEISADVNGLREIEKLFNVPANTLKAFVDPMRTKFFNDVKSLKQPKGKYSPDAVQVWEYFLKVTKKHKNLSNDNYVRFYTRLRKTLAQSTSIMIASNLGTASGSGERFTAYILRDGQPTAEIFSVEGRSSLSLNSRDRSLAAEMYV